MNRTADVHIPKEELDRVATQFIKAANSYSCQISITQGAHSVNGKSLLGFLSMMQKGGPVVLSAEGVGEGIALEALTSILEMK